MAKIEITKTELVWPGKYNEDGTLKEVPRVSLPFQVIETVNESRADREAKKLLQQAGRPAGAVPRQRSRQRRKQAAALAYAAAYRSIRRPLGACFWPGFLWWGFVGLGSSKSWPHGPGHEPTDFSQPRESPAPESGLTFHPLNV